MTFNEVENEINYFIESTMFKIRDLRKQEYSKNNQNTHSALKLPF